MHGLCSLYSLCMTTNCHWWNYYNRSSKFQLQDKKHVVDYYYHYYYYYYYYYYITIMLLFYYLEESCVTDLVPVYGH